MIEVYVGTSENVELRIYAGGSRVDSANTVTAELFDVDGESVTSHTVSIVPTGVSGEDKEYYTYPIELTETEEEAAYKLVWSFQPTAGVDATRTDHVKVVTPYAWPDQVREEFPTLASRTYDELKHLERVVRYNIDVFCGQSFGYQPSAKHVMQGNNSRFLWLPRRIETLSTIADEHAAITSGVQVVEDGWMLAHPYGDGVYRDVKADLGLERGVNKFFRSGHMYTITGAWGWPHVPFEVQQAASILIGKSQEPESNWRKYNTSVVRANDWRIEFDRSSGETTGDAEVDIMLQPYKAPSVWVI